MSQNEPMRDTQVTKELQEMDGILGEIEKSIMALDGRLATVVRVGIKEMADEEENISLAERLVPLAGNLLRKNNVLRGFLAALNDMRQRIEV